jgi:hypothetical protein
MRETLRVFCLTILFMLILAPYECKPYGEPEAPLPYDPRYNPETDLVLHAEIDAGLDAEAGLEEGDGCFEPVACIIDQ